MLVCNYLRCDCAVLYLTYVKNITIVNSTFSDNNCTSVVPKSSIFHLQGTVGFTGIQATYTVVGLLLSSMMHTTVNPLKQSRELHDAEPLVTHQLS